MKRLALWMTRPIYRAVGIITIASLLNLGLWGWCFAWMESCREWSRTGTWQRKKWSLPMRGFWSK